MITDTEQLSLLQTNKTNSNRLESQFRQSISVDEKNNNRPIYNPQIEAERTINSIFPTQLEENKIQHIRTILGEKAVSLSDEEIETSISQFEYLVNCWMDEFEMEIFEGKTLYEVLRLEKEHEK